MGMWVVKDRGKGKSANNLEYARAQNKNIKTRNAMHFVCTYVYRARAKFQCLWRDKR